MKIILPKTKPANIVAVSNAFSVFREWSSSADCTWRLFAFDFASAHSLSGLFLLLALLEKYRAGWDFATSTTFMYKSALEGFMLHATTAGFQICSAASFMFNSTASLLFCVDALLVVWHF